MSAASVIAKLLSVATLGKTLKVGEVTAGLVDVVPSTDASNIIGFGSDGGLFAVPTKLALVKTEFFTSTSLVANGAGWTKDSRARWVVIIAVGGGGSGTCINSANANGYGGGDPGSLEIWSGWASDLPATADITVGAGGAAPTQAAAGYGNDGSPSKFGNLITASGGRYGANLARFNGYGQRTLPVCSLRLGCAGTDANLGGARNADPTPLGPGAGGGPNGTGGSASVARTASTVPGPANPASGGSPGNGAAAIANDPWSFGAGGAGCNYSASPAIAGGSGGVPGGGGGCGYYYTGNSTVLGAAAAGGRGEIRVLTYG